MNLNDVGDSGDKVLYPHDLLATGGTAIATQLIKGQRAEVAGFSFLIELAFLNARTSLYKYSSNINSIAKY